MDRRGVAARGQSIIISFQFHGVQCRETLKLKPTKANLKYADRLKCEIVNGIEKGTFHYGDFFPSSNTKTARMFGNTGRTINIRDALERWMNAKKRELSESTYETYANAVNIHLIPYFGDKMLSSLTSIEVREWIGSLEASNKYINNLLTPLRGVYSDAFSDEMIDNNPMLRVKNLKNNPREPEPFTQEEQLRILSAFLYKQDRNLFQFMLWTGLRPSEVIELEWDDVDMVKAECRVTRSRRRGVLKTPKTAAGIRTVDLLSPAMEALQSQKPMTFLAGTKIFLNQRTNEVWKEDRQIRDLAWGYAIKKSGVKYREPYQCRHTFASMMLTAGEDIAWIAKQMGHANINILQKRYARWIPNANKSAGKKAENMFHFNTSSTQKKENV